MRCTMPMRRLALERVDEVETKRGDGHVWVSARDAFRLDLDH